MENITIKTHTQYYDGNQSAYHMVTVVDRTIIILQVIL